MPPRSKFIKAIFAFLLLLLSIQPCISTEDVCQSTQCSDYGPNIKFPFRLKGQPESCGYKGFELSCRGDETVLQLPSSELYISYISYEAQGLAVYDPNGCLARSLLHLNLSASPFRFANFTDFYYYAPRFYNARDTFYWSSLYKLINCSSNVYSSTSDFYAVPCLRNLPGIFYFVNSQWQLEVESACRVITNEAFPLSPTRDKLFLAWDEPDCGHRCGDGACRLKNGTSNETECVYQEPVFYDPYTPRGSNPHGVIIGICLAAFFAIAALVILLIYKKIKAEKKRKQDIKIEKFLEEYKALKPTRYSYAKIKKMTSSFKDELGQGGYGNVFKGELPNGVPVAVKVFENPTVNGEEFINEVGTIGRIHHINVVRLLGFCVEGSKRALIYEFMPNGSLGKFIFEQGRWTIGFSWLKLLEIALGIARGIEYLHQGCDHRILHFDIKPQNILLDDKFTPKVSDFGLAKLCSKEKSIVSVSAARGTMDYIAPELFLRKLNLVSHKSDVYSFGKLLLELVGVRKNTDKATLVDRTQVYFPEWIYKQLEMGAGLDLITASDEDVEIARKLSTVALWCVQWNPVDRPSMKVVVQMLEGSIEFLSLPPNPFTSHADRTQQGINDTA